MFKSVTVIDFPSLICLRNNGITDPRENITLPYLVTAILVFDFGLFRANDIAVFSIKAFDIPIAFMG